MNVTLHTPAGPVRIKEMDADSILDLVAVFQNADADTSLEFTLNENKKREYQIFVLKRHIQFITIGEHTPWYKKIYHYVKERVG